MEALHLTQSPENGTVWVTADRLDERASHASVHASGEWLTSPRGLRQHRVEQQEGSNPGVQGASWARRACVGTGDVTAAVHMGSLSWDGTWLSDAAVHSRGGKGPAFKHPCKGTHRHDARRAPSVSPNLARRGEQAQAPHHLVWTSLDHPLADIEPLRACDQLLKGNKAVGVDEGTTSMYAKDLEANLPDLSTRLTRMGYKPQPKRRIDIAKPGRETGRPLGISSFEDKMVDLATQRGLEPLFEPLGEDCRYGYRPQRSPHPCLDALGRTLQHKQVNILVEADIRGFVDAGHHEWLRTLLRQRSGDARVLRLISRRGQAGIMEDGLVQAAEVGTPQGSMLSPLLAHVSLHDV